MFGREAWKVVSAGLVTPSVRWLIIRCPYTLLLTTTDSTAVSIAIDLLRASIDFLVIALVRARTARRFGPAITWIWRIE